MERRPGLDGWRDIERWTGLNFDPAADWSQDSGSFGVWHSALATNTRGDFTSTNGPSFLRCTSAGAARYLLNSSGNANASGLVTTLGMRAVVRESASAIRLHGPDGAQIASGTIASAADTSDELYIGNPEGSYSDASMLGAFAAGEALSASELASIASICGALQDHFA